MRIRVELPELRTSGYLAVVNEGSEVTSTIYLIDDAEKAQKAIDDMEEAIYQLQQIIRVENQ